MARRETILASIAEQGKLTDELKARIDATFDKSELEDLYLPYRPKRRTKATMAREKGLEPLALYLWAQQPGAEPLETFAASFVNAEKGVNGVEEALEGARHIVAEIISEDADLRKALRQMMSEEGVVVSRKVPDAADEQEKFKMYYEYREPVKAIPSHRMLAIRRGESEGVLSFLIELEPLHAVSMLKTRILRAQAIGLRSLNSPSKTPGSACSILPFRPKSAWRRSTARMGKRFRSFVTICTTCCWRRRRGPFPFWESTPACAPVARLR